MAISSISGASALLQNSSIKKKQENIAQDLAVPAAVNVAPPTQASTTQGVTSGDAAAKTKYTAQDIAQRMAEANDKVMAEFLEIAKKSPAERIRDQILKAKGLTEEDVEAMSPEKREALEKEIADIIKDKIEEGVKKAMLNPEQVAHPNVSSQQVAPNYEDKADKAKLLDLQQDKMTNVDAKKKENTAFLEEMLMDTASA